MFSLPTNLYFNIGGQVYYRFSTDMQVLYLNTRENIVHTRALDTEDIKNFSLGIAEQHTNSITAEEFKIAWEGFLIKLDLNPAALASEVLKDQDRAAEKPKYKYY